MDENQLLERQINNLGQRIKSLRVGMGYTNAEKFAYQHNISRSQYAQYEKGKDLRFSSLLKLSQAFEISLQQFFAEGFEGE